MVWKYTEVLNTGLAVLLNVAAGVAIGAFRILPQNAYNTINAAVFKVFLPALICRGIGLKTDLYDSDIWRFIGAFLLLRLIALLFAAASALLHPKIRRDYATLPGRMVVDWLGLCWISTVILGVPVLKSAMGDQYAKFGVLAGISSFLFQLPVMLMLLEMHKWLAASLPITRQDAARNFCMPQSPAKVTDINGNASLGAHAYHREGHDVISAADLREESTMTTGTCAKTLPPLTTAIVMPGGDSANPCAASAASTAGSGTSTTGTSSSSAYTSAHGRVSGTTSQSASDGYEGAAVGGESIHGHKRNEESAPLATDSRYIKAASPRAAFGGGDDPQPSHASRPPLHASAARLASAMLRNHVLWGIAIGFVLSLSKVGTTWLDPGPPPTIVNGKAVYKPNEDFIEELGFIDQFLDFLGRCTTPVALFAMGLWIPTQWHDFLGASNKHHRNKVSAHGKAVAGAEEIEHCSGPPTTARDVWLHWLKVLCMLAFKLIICPLLMVGIAKGFDLPDGDARAAVLVATIPISLASFTLAQQFNVGEALLTKLVVLGTALLLPTAVLWLEALDSTDTFLLPAQPAVAAAMAGSAGQGNVTAVVSGGQ